MKTTFVSFRRQYYIARRKIFSLLLMYYSDVTTRMENGKIDRSGTIHSIYILFMATADKLIRMDLKIREKSTIYWQAQADCNSIKRLCV